MSVNKEKTLPTKIKVLGKEIQVIKTEMKPEEFGEYCQHRYIIKINKKSNYIEARQTLFHEAIHAALHIGGLSSVIPVGKNIDLEEAIVICLENAFFHIVDINNLTS